MTNRLCRLSFFSAFFLYFSGVHLPDWVGRKSLRFFSVIIDQSWTNNLILSLKLTAHAWSLILAWEFYMGGGQIRDTNRSTLWDSWVSFSRFHMYLPLYYPKGAVIKPWKDGGRKCRYSPDAPMICFQPYTSKNHATIRSLWGRVRSHSFWSAPCATYLMVHCREGTYWEFARCGVLVQKCVCVGCAVSWYVEAVWI